MGGGKIDADFRKILVHGVKHGSLGITEPRLSEESAYNTSKASIGELVGCILGGNDLNYVGRRAFVRRASSGVRKEKKYVYMAELDI